MTAGYVHCALGALLLASLGAACGDGCNADTDSASSKVKTDEARHGLSKKQAKQVLAKVGDRVITVGEFADSLASQSPYLRARYQSPERKLEYLENMIRFELLALEAKRLGLTDLPVVQRQRDKMLVQELLKREVNETIKLTDIGNAAIKSYYDAHPEEFSKPAQVRASHILLSDREKAKRLMEKVLAAPNDDELFRRLVQQDSQDVRTNTRGGDLRFFSRPDQKGEDEPDIPASVARAAFSLEQVGDVYPTVVESSRGFHILKLTGRRDALKRELKDVSRVIQNKLWRERREKKAKELVARLRKDAQVKEYDNVLRDLNIEPSK